MWFQPCALCPVPTRLLPPVPSRPAHLRRGSEEVRHQRPVWLLRGGHPLPTRSVRAPQAGLPGLVRKLISQGPWGRPAHTWALCTCLHAGARASRRLGLPPPTHPLPSVGAPGALGCTGHEAARCPDCSLHLLCSVCTNTSVDCQPEGGELPAEAALRARPWTPGPGEGDGGVSSGSFSPRASLVWRLRHPLRFPAWRARDPPGIRLFGGP